MPTINPKEFILEKKSAALKQIENIKTIIDKEEKESGPQTFIMKSQLYPLAKEICHVAENLIEEIDELKLVLELKNNFYLLLMQGMEKLEAVIKLPSIDNAKALHDFTNIHQFYTEQEWDKIKLSKLKAKMIQIAGITLGLGSFVVGWVFLVPSLGFSNLGAFFGILTGLLIYKSQHAKSIQLDKFLTIMNESKNSPFNQTPLNTKQRFFKLMIEAGDIAHNIGEKAEEEFKKIEVERKNNDLYIIMKIRAV